MDDEEIQPAYSNRMADLVATYDWLDKADASEEPYILVPHPGFLSDPEQEIVYGLVQAVRFSGRVIGYLEVDLKLEELENLMEFTDEEGILLQVVLDDRRLLYSSTEEKLVWPEDTAEDEFTLVSPENSDTKYNAWHIHMEDPGLSGWRGNRRPRSRPGSRSATPRGCPRRSPG